jgi:uncharacterized protein (TIGR02466 family)
MKTFELFPTPVGVYDLQRKITDEEKSFVGSLLETTTQNAGNRTSKNTYVLRQQELSDLQKFCFESINYFSQEVMKYKNLKLRITQSWLNETIKGGFHHMHRHPNSILSGVFYIKTGQEDRINFAKNGDKDSFVFETDSYNSYNSETWWLPVKEAELFIFPSHLWHSVPPIESECRISLSFNTFSAGSFGSIDQLSHTDL